MKKYIFFLFSIIMSLSIQAQSIEERDAFCKKEIERAFASDIDYAKKIALFDSLRSSIVLGVSPKIVVKYQKALSKLFAARDPKNSANNRLLEELYAHSCGIPDLQSFQKTLASWLDQLTEENKGAAASTKQKFTLYVPKEHGYIHALKKEDQYDIAVKAEDTAEPSRVFIIEGALDLPLTTQTKYFMRPLYLNTPHTLISFSQEAPIAIQFKKQSPHIKNIYPHDFVQLIITDMHDHSLHQCWAKIETLSQEQWFSIEHQYFKDSFSPTTEAGSLHKKSLFLQEKLSSIPKPLLSSQKETIAQTIESLTQNLDSSSLIEKQEIRNTIAQTLGKLAPSYEKKKCKKIFTDLEKSLESESLVFGDIIKIEKDNRIFDIKHMPQNRIEPFALTESSLSKNPTSYLKIVSPLQKQGIIRYGDQITLIPLYIQEEGKLKKLSESYGLARREKEHRGDSYPYLGITELCHTTPGSYKTTFILTPQKELTYLQKKGCCLLAGQQCNLLHQASNQYISFDENAPVFKKYSFSDKKTALTLQKVTPQELSLALEMLCSQELQTLNTEKIARKKIAKAASIRKLLTETQNPKQTHMLWNSLATLLDQKEALSSQELSFLTAEVNACLHLPALNANKKQKEIALMLSFYTKLKQAEELHGAKRLQAYHSLLPYVQHPVLAKLYKNELFAKIQGLYKRKSNELTSIQSLVEMTTHE